MRELKRRRSIILAALLMALVAPSVVGDLVVDGGFDIGIVGTYEGGSSNFGGANLSAPVTGVAAGTDIYNDGWVTYGNGGSRWATNAVGALERTTTVNFQFGGVGQIVSNPGTATYDSGSPISFSFDYAIATDDSNGLVGALYGIRAPNGTNATWNVTSGAEAISGFGQSNTVSIDQDYSAGTDYEFTLLYDSGVVSGNGALASTTAGFQTHQSGPITLTQDYDLFAVVFQADNNGEAQGTLQIDNVSVIPEPNTLWLLLGGLWLVGGRLRRS